MLLSDDIKTLAMAKSSREDPNTYHPCTAHMTDAGVCAIIVWDCFPESKRRAMVDAFGLPEPLVRYICVVLIALHDIGKISPPFVKKFPVMKENLCRALGLRMPGVINDNAFHGIVTAFVLEELLTSGALGVRFDANTSHALSMSIGGHHGWMTSMSDLPHHQIITREMMSRPNVRPAIVSAGGDISWFDYRDGVARWLIGRFRDAIAPPAWDGEVSLGPAAIEMLLGFTSFCDWTASAFMPCDPTKTADQYFDGALAAVREHTGRVAEVVGGWRPDRARDFRGSFPYNFGGDKPRYTEVRNLQAAAELINIDPGIPNIIVPLAQTGGGKTDTGLFLCSRLASEAGADAGIVFSFPTQAQANDKLVVLKDFIEANFMPGTQEQLAHGEYMFVEDFIAIKEEAAKWRNDHAGDEPPVSVEVFYMGNGRPLAADTCLCTVDQAMMAVIRVRHHSFRIWALSGKVFVFDEIHAYDVYMRVIIESLLAWLGRIGCSVILMSATIPKRKVRQLIARFLGREDVAVDILRQPCLVQASAIGSDAISFEAEEVKHTTTEWIDSASMAQVAHREYLSGGCGVVFCDTVRRCQNIVAYLEFRGVPVDELLPLHSRFIRIDRLASEKRLMNLLGPLSVITGQRPKRHLLVTTQAGEVSLDYDNDYIICQMAPIDVIFQRLGRERRFDLVRPENRPDSILYLAVPGGNPKEPFRNPDPDDDDPDHAILIYGAWPILTTQLALLRHGGSLVVPDDVEDLVEFVYESSLEEMLAVVDELDLTDGQRRRWKARLAKARGDYDKQMEEHRKLAEKAIIPDPNGSASGHVEACVKEGDESHYSRLVGASAQVVIAYRRGGKLAFDPEMTDPCDPTAIDDFGKIAELAGHSLRVSSDEDLIEALDGEKYFPEEWREHGFLKRYRLLTIPPGGEAVVNGEKKTHNLSYTKRKGLVNRK